MSLQQWLGDLASAHGVRGLGDRLLCRDSVHGRGLFAGGNPIRRGEVILSVPKKMTLLIQDGAGLSLPKDGTWPRVRAGVAAEAPEAGKCWEFTLARAIVDAVAGDGGEFWRVYSQLLPSPDELAHPFLLSEDLLAELQDDELAAEGRREKIRITELLADLLGEAVLYVWVSSQPRFLTPNITIVHSWPPYFASQKIPHLPWTRAGPRC